MYACKIPWLFSSLISTLWVYVFRVTNNTLIVLPSCPSLSIRPVETWEIWQLPCQNPGAPPPVFPWCVHLHNPDGGWSELSLVLIITGSSSKHSQIFLLACIHTPEVQNLPSWFVKYRQQPFRCPIFFAKAFLCAQMEPVPAASGIGFLLSPSNNDTTLFNLKFMLLDRKTKVKWDLGNFWCLHVPSFPFASNWAKTACVFSLELFGQTVFPFCVRYFCCSSTSRFLVQQMHFKPHLTEDLPATLDFS